MALLTMTAISHDTWVGAVFFAVSAFAEFPPAWKRICASRKRDPVAGRAALAFIGFIGGGLALIIATAGGSEVTSTNAGKGEACATSGRVTQVDFAVKTEAQLRSGPDPKADPISIQIGSDIRPVTIDDTMPVRELCRTDGWSEVRVMLLPSDIGKAQGWVPTPTLRFVPVNAAGRRVYVASDIEWPKGSKPFRKAALTVINRLAHENPKCDAINTQSLLVGKDENGARLHVVCYGDPEQSIDFRPADATNGRSFVPVEATTREIAMRVCEAGARERIVHPSTADFSIIGARFAARADGSSVYKTTFTAKNAFNLELKFRVECSLKGEDLTAVDVFEAGG